MMKKNTDFKEAYKGPFEDFGYYKVFTSVGVAEALSKSEVKWVPDVMLSGNGGGNNAMDAVGLRMVMDIADKLNNSKK